MLQEQESAGTADPETITMSSSELDKENTREGDILLKRCLRATASSSQSPRGDKEIVEAIKQFNNHTRFPRKTDNIFEWWNKQPESDLKRITNIALALTVTQASVERTFSGLR